MGLIELAIEEGMPTEDFETAEPEIIYSIELLKFKIATIKTSLAWIWCTGDEAQKEAVRRQVAGGLF